MTMTGAVKKLQANGWNTERVGRDMKAVKSGQRDIILRGSVDGNYVDYIAIRVYSGNHQFDSSVDVRFCDTIKEAMHAA